MPVIRNFNVLCVSSFDGKRESWHQPVDPAQQSAKLTAEKAHEDIPDDFPKDFVVHFYGALYPVLYVNTGLTGTCVALGVKVPNSSRTLKLYTDIPIGNISVKRLQEIAVEESQKYRIPPQPWKG